MAPLDVIGDELRKRGWSVGDLSYHDSGSLVWQVYGHWGEQRVLARAAAQETAWKLAAAQVLEVRQDQFLSRLATIEEQLQSAATDDLIRGKLLEETDALEYELGLDNFFRRDLLV
jgi:hypothetical protein